MKNYLRASGRYALGLRTALQSTIDPNEARRRIADSLAGREDKFLHTLKKGVYAIPNSPYLRLLRHAGIDFEDVCGLVTALGLEGALDHLYSAGVYISADEVKARKPIRRGSLEFQVSESDFDNPLAEAAFEGRSSGTSGKPTRVFIGFDLLHDEVPYYSCLFEAHSVSNRPLGVWHAALQTTLKTVFKHAGCDRRPEVWWSSGRFDWGIEAWKREYIFNSTVLLSRIYGKPLPRPRYLPRGDVYPVMHWLAEKVGQGTPPVLETNHSSAVRICLAIDQAGLDIQGTAFHVVGEPLTSAKAEVIVSAGAKTIDRYANVEVGVMALACARPDGYDDLHLVSDKLALLQREVTLPGIPNPINALAFTTLSSSTPKLWLNVENGDYASVSQRDCGCPFGELGFKTHLSGVRAHDKLTSEGLTIPANDLMEIVESFLPSRFGGGPTDYQFIEEEEGGVPKVSLAIRPSIGPLEETEVLAELLKMLGRTSGVRRADEWRNAGTLRVVRRDPLETHSAKILPLHVSRVSS
jgi:hypothetical protein